MDPRDDSLGTLPRRRDFLAGAAAAVAAAGGFACAGSGRKEGVPAASKAPEPRVGAARVLRLPARMRRDVRGQVTPLSYSGGFDTKTAIYETLVRAGPDGRLAPGLAEAWSTHDGGTTHRFRLRAGATFHDGSPADAEAVRLHFRRWAGLPQHSWLESNERITTVTALGARELEIRTDRPCALQPDLAAINPCSITAPGCFDEHGEWVRPIGSGQLRFVEVLDEGRRIRCAPFPSTTSTSAAPLLVEFVAYTSDDARRPLDDLLDGALDALVDSWSERIPPEQVTALARDERFRTGWGPGGAVTFLAFRLDGGPTASSAVRRRIADAIDRDELVREIEGGHADACTSWAPPTIRDWPAPVVLDVAPTPPTGVPALRFPRAKASGTEELREARLHALLAERLRRAGFEVELSVHPSAELQALLVRGDYDLIVLRTHGVPYDPVLSLARFLPPKPRASASSSWRILGDPQFSALVAELMDLPEEAQRFAHYARLQQHLDHAVTVVPLYVPRRTAVVRRDLALPPLDHDLYRLDYRAWLGSA